MQPESAVYFSLDCKHVQCSSQQLPQCGEVPELCWIRASYIVLQFTRRETQGANPNWLAAVQIISRLLIGLLMTCQLYTDGNLGWPTQWRKNSLEFGFGSIFFQRKRRLVVVGWSKGSLKVYKLQFQPKCLFSNFSQVHAIFTVVHLCTIGAKYHLETF